ncbi:MAG TPA: hypothetical protein VFZ48_05205 [Candidatus Saccharimonadales bacterium]
MATDPRSLPTDQLVTNVAVATAKYMAMPRHRRDDDVMESLQKVSAEIDLWLASKKQGFVLLGQGKAPMDDREMRRLCLEFLLKGEVTDDDLEQRP